MWYSSKTGLNRLFGQRRCKHLADESLRGHKVLFEVFERNLHVEEVLGSIWGTK